MLVGFSAGAALFIASSQLPKLFGIEGAHGSFFERIWHLIRELAETSWWTLGVGVACLVALVLLEARFHKLPIPLFVVVAAILLMWLSDLEERGVEVAGSITQGLPTPGIPTVPGSDIPELIGLAFGVFLLSYVEGIGVAKTLATREERVDPDQELFANGVANVATGFFRGFSVGGSMSRSAVTASTGSKTPLAGAFVAIVLAIVLLFLTKPFSFLPEATLAAIVLVAVKHLFKYQEMIKIWQSDRREGVAVLATFFGVLVFGMLEGIIIGVLVTFILLLARMARPHVSTLGQVAGTNDFVDLGRNPGAQTPAGVVIYRSNTGWFYVNAPEIVDQLLADIGNQTKRPDTVILDLATAPNIDLGAVEALAGLREDLESDGTTLELANVYAGVAAVIQRNASGFDALKPNESVEDILRRRHGRTETRHSHDSGVNGDEYE